MERARLKYLTKKYIDQSISTMSNIKGIARIDIEEKIEEELFITLAFIGSCLEKIKGEETEVKLISAFKYAWNVTKHSEKVYILMELDYTHTAVVGYGAVGRARLGNITPFVLFRDLPLTSERYKNQYQNYMDFLCNTDISIKLNEIYKIIDKYL